MPDGVIYKPCGNRRAAVCPACAEVYRADTYQLVLAGLQGGKGVSENVRRHPCAFPTLTAPSFGLVHSTRAKDGRNRTCRPGRKPRPCPHGVDLRCRRCTPTGRRSSAGRCAWTATTTPTKPCGTASPASLAPHLRGSTSSAATPKPTESGAGVVREGRRDAGPRRRPLPRPLRLDGIDDADPTAVVEPPACADYTLLAYAITEAVRTTRFRTPPHPDNPTAG